jgi:hypothetical protein
MYAQLSDIRNWKTQIDLRFFSTLRYPPDWKAEDVNTDGYVIKSPAENDTDTFRENVSFFAMEVPDSVMTKDVKNYAEANFRETRKIIQDLRLMVNKHVTMNGIPMYLVIYNGVYNGRYLYWKQLFCLYDNVAYMLTYTGAAGKKDKYAIEGGDILSSFKPHNVMKG